jgi:hypothetical protein
VSHPPNGVIQLPLATEVLNKNADLHPGGKAEGNKIIIEFDTRKRDYNKMFKLKRGVKIHWLNERTFEAQELSGFAWPIIYRITTADGYGIAQIRKYRARNWFTVLKDKLPPAIWEGETARPRSA